MAPIAKPQRPLFWAGIGVLGLVAWMEVAYALRNHGLDVAAWAASWDPLMAELWLAEDPIAPLVLGVYLAGALAALLSWGERKAAALLGAVAAGLVGLILGGAWAYSAGMLMWLRDAAPWTGSAIPG